MTEKRIERISLKIHCRSDEKFLTIITTKSWIEWPYWLQWLDSNKKWGCCEFDINDWMKEIGDCWLSQSIVLLAKLETISHNWCGKNCGRKTDKVVLRIWFIFVPKKGIRTLVAGACDGIAEESRGKLWNWRGAEMEVLRCALIQGRK